MWRLALLLLFSVQLAGCAAISTIAAIPAALFDSAAYLVRGEEASLPIGVERTLAAAQQGLRQVSMPAEFVVPNEHGYLLQFGESPFDGKMTLTRQTPTLSTIYIKVRKGISRMDTVERTLIEEIRKHAQALPPEASFDHTGYARLFTAPDDESRVMGWIRLAGKNDARVAHRPGWFRVSLPSGRVAYFRRG